MLRGDEAGWETEPKWVRIECVNCDYKNVILKY